MAVGIDSRFKFAVPVYGCGFLAEDSAWSPGFAAMNETRRALWQKYWDPAQYLPNAKQPVLWVTGDMDGAFSLKITRMSASLLSGRCYLSIQRGMEHSHESGEAPPEIAAFAEQILHRGRPLAVCDATGCSGLDAWAKFGDVAEAAVVRCACTLDSGRWMGRKWCLLKATWDATTGRATCSLPTDTTAFYFVLTDDRGLMSSSEPEDVTEAVACSTR